MSSADRLKYNGRLYAVRVGARGGRYIKAHGQTLYVNSLVKHQKGGVFVGPKPPDKADLSHEQLEAMGIKAAEDDAGVSLDPVNLEPLDVAHPSNIVSYARGRAHVTSMSLETMKKLLRSNRRDFKDPMTRQPLHAEIRSHVQQRLTPGVESESESESDDEIIYLYDDYCTDILPYIWDEEEEDVKPLEDDNDDNRVHFAFSPDGKLVATGADNWNYKPQLWEISADDLETTTCHQVDNDEFMGSKKVAFSYDGRLLAVLQSKPGDHPKYDHVIVYGVVDESTDHPIKYILGEYGWDEITDISFSPIDNLIAVSEGKNVHVYELNNTSYIRIRRRKQLKHGGNVKAVVFSPGGATIATRALDNKVYLWNAASGSLLRTIHNENIRNIHRLFTPLYPIAYSPDGTKLAVSHRGVFVRIYRTSDGELLREIHDSYRPENIITSLAFSPDGLIAAGYSNGLLRMSRVSDGEYAHDDLFFVIHHGFNPITCIAFFTGENFAFGANGSVRLCHKNPSFVGGSRNRISTKTKPKPTSTTAAKNEKANKKKQKNKK